MDAANARGVGPRGSAANLSPAGGAWYGAWGVMTARKRRVVLLTRRYGGEIGATTSRLSAYVGALQEAGAEVTVVTRFPFADDGTGAGRGPRVAYRRDHVDGATVLRMRLPGARVLDRLLAGALRLGARRAGARALASGDLIELLHGVLALPVIAAVRPNVVIVEQGPAWLALPMWIVSRLGTPLVLQVSDIKSLAMARGQYGARPASRIALTRRIEDTCYRRAAAIVTVTASQRTHIAQRLHGREGALQLIPNGAELGVLGDVAAARRSDAKQRLGLGGRFVALYAGTFGAAHDLPTLLDAAERLRGVPDIAVLLLGGGPLDAELQRAAAARGLTNVRFRPGVPVSELAPILAAADAGISTEIGGLRDTVRAKIYLYMAARLPVIATDDGGEVRALIDRAGAGLLVPPGDPAAIAARLLDLRRRPAVAATLGENGRRFVEQHHDRAQLASRFAEVVLRAAAPDGRPDSRVSRVGALRR